jgi:adenylate cyclase
LTCTRAATPHAGPSCPVAAADLAEWLLREGRQCPAVRDLVAGIGRRLVAAGVPVWRLFVGLRQLHPASVGRAVVWFRDGDRVLEKERPHGAERTDYYRANPVSAIFERGEPVRCRLTTGGGPLDFPFLATLRGEGGTDYLALPLLFHGRRHQAVAFTSDRLRGFDAGDVAILEAIVPALGAAAEILSEREEIRRLLATYVGPRAGERILSGAIRRGECETVDAVVWLCDMREFTGLSEALPRRELIAILDAYLDAVVTPTEAHGGEVLKFIGDGVLAVFPLEGESSRRAPSACRAAMDAAREAVASVQRNVRADGVHGVECGIGLDVEEVAYGNVGASDRLDFTVIGPAVNVATRLEALTRKRPLLARVVASEAFVQACGERLQPLGRPWLKGFPERRLAYRVV